MTHMTYNNYEAGTSLCQWLTRIPIGVKAPYVIQHHNLPPFQI